MCGNENHWEPTTDYSMICLEVGLNRDIFNSYMQEFVSR